MPFEISAIAYVICAIAYLFVAILLIASRAQHRYKALLLTACLLTSLWAGSVALSQINFSLIPVVEQALVVLEQLRSLAWISVVAFVLFVAYGKRVAPVMGYGLAGLSVIAFVYALSVTIADVFFTIPPALTVRMVFVASILVSVAGLLLIENLFRNSGEQSRWAVKYLCFALGTVFAFDFYVHAEAALFGQLDQTSYAARGLVDAMAAPLIVVAAARSKSWPIDLHVSRKLVFHSATLVGAGLYLIAMSGVAYYLRSLNSSWGILVQVGFVVAALLGLAILLTSNSVQAHIRNFISRNFFTYRYDYRQEWLRFISAISDGAAELSVPARILRSVANIVDSTAGALWVYRDDDDAYIHIESWNISNMLPSISKSDALVTLLAGNQGTIDITRHEIDGKKYGDLPLPDGLTNHPRAWLIVPLIHQSGLIGFLVLGPSRAPRSLDWEDFDLLRTVGRQAGSYIAENNTARSLARARRFEEFNRQFAFVVHDIKNLAGQMSLILENAQRYGNNPEFQKDMLATIADSLERMQNILKQLKQQTAPVVMATRFDVVPVVKKLSGSWGLQIPNFNTEFPEASVFAVGDSERLTTVLNHLIQNAFDAAGTEGTVTLSLSPAHASNGSTNTWTSVTVADTGPGMDQNFINEKLFQPLDGTKSSGFGIGAFQARQLVREMGGKLEVDSVPGDGTRFVVSLPSATATVPV